MARMIPTLTEEQLDRLDSQAEARMYRLGRDALPDRVVVLHRIEWIVRHAGDGAEDGEADFLVCDPKGGLLVLDVKGKMEGKMGENGDALRMRNRVLELRR